MGSRRFRCSLRQRRLRALRPIVIVDGPYLLNKRRAALVMHAGGDARDIVDIIRRRRIESIVLLLLVSTTGLYRTQISFGIMLNIKRRHFLLLCFGLLIVRLR